MFKNFSKDFLRGLLYFYGAIIFALVGVVVIANKYFPNQLSNWSNLASIGQFLIEFFLIPFALVAFLLSLVEIRKSSQYANLDIDWNSETELTKAYTVRMPRSKKYSTNSIILTNTGNNPSIIYQIVLDVPKEFLIFKMTDLLWIGQAYDKYERFFYRGTEMNKISYPDSPIDLGKIEFSDSSKLPSKLILPFHISCDKGEYKKGQLVINFDKKWLLLSQF